MTVAGTTTLSAATTAGKKACPVCIGYYGTGGGSYYHNVFNCQGMTNAVTRTRTWWEKSGKTACPVCIGTSEIINYDSVPASTQVFATTNGTYFHTSSTCSGTKNAAQNSLTRAVQMGKTACPTCVKPSTLYVFATTNGTYYHTDSTCSGMKNAQYVKAETAISSGKTACPTCAKALTGVKGFTPASTASATAAPATNATATYVYCATNGTYFHTEANCSGMSGAKNVTYASAVSAGKQLCTKCVKSSSITVFCTSGGRYYHTSSTCSGMTDATAMTASKAIGYGKTACPTCAKALGTAFKAAE